MSLSGKRALVTGGGRGIGRSIAERLVAEGATVFVSGRSADELGATAEAIGARAVVADLGERAAVATLAAAVGDLDILVNNAGQADSAPLDKTTDELWDRLLEINATAPFRLTRAFVPGMASRGWGRVINIASNAGVSGYAYTAAYCASKHALVGQTRALAVDLARTGVTINAICPGWVATAMVDDATARIAEKTGRSVADARATLAAMNPQKRLIEPSEIAYVVAMLCADGARSIHGQTLVIDGGAVLK